jgi:ArsR family metal-binding transcriptional regulator
MKCSLCGGLVTWRGPLVALTHTQCADCGERNCQEVECDLADDDPEFEDCNVEDSYAR